MDGLQRECAVKGCPDSCYEVYYIKEAALKLLLAGLGQTQWYGLFSEETVQGTGVYEKPGRRMRHAGGQSGKNAAVNSVLAEMYLAGVIDWDGQGVAVRQPYARMLSVMLEQKICVTCVGMDSLSVSMLRCCYLSRDSAVAVRKSQREDGMLGLTQLDVREWERMLGEACVRLADGERLRAVKRSSLDGKDLRAVQVWKAGIRDVWVEQDGEKRCLYAAESAGKVLGQMLWPGRMGTLDGGIPGS